jgi:hypothetical protein
MTTLSQLNSDLQNLSLQLNTLAATPCPPFGVVDVPAINAAAGEALAAANHIAGLGGKTASPTSAVDSCDHEVGVALAMVTAVNGGTPGTLTVDGVLSQVTTAAVMANHLS